MDDQLKAQLYHLGSQTELEHEKYLTKLTLVIYYSSLGDVVEAATFRGCKR